MRRRARELEVGDEVFWDGRWYTVTAIDVEHRQVRLTFGNELCSLRLGTWTKVRCAA